MLVAGGTGRVGCHAVARLLDRGATVIVPACAEERIDALRRWIAGIDLEGPSVPPVARSGLGLEARLLTMHANVGSREGAEHVLEEVQERFGALDAVVAAAWLHWEGAPLTQVMPRTWARTVEAHLRSHLVLARVFLPPMTERSGSSYTFAINHACERPVADAGPTSVASAAELMMARVLMKEYEGCLVRVNVLVIGPVSEHAIRSREASRAVGGSVQPLFSAAPLPVTDVGALLARLASSEAEDVSGSVIHVLKPEELAAWLS